jgi:hypothetical protein
MRRVFIGLAAAGLVAAACGGAGSGAATTAPVAAATTAAATTAAATTAAPAARNTFVFTADLASANENPPIADATAPAAKAEASGSGTATVTINTTRDTTGKIVGATAKFEIVLKGFPTTTMITISHIHKGDAKTNGGVVVDSGMKAAEPIVLTTGGTSITKDNLSITDLVLAADILANPGNYYYNVHSMLHAGGVVRGQLKPKA